MAKEKPIFPEQEKEDDPFVVELMEKRDKGQFFGDDGTAKTPKRTNATGCRAA